MNSAAVSVRYGVRSTVDLEKKKKIRCLDVLGLSYISLYKVHGGIRRANSKIERN